MPTTETILEQNFINANNRLSMIAERGADSANFVKARAEESFLHEQRLVGALAAARLEKDALASAILAQRSASDQPQKSAT